MRQEGMGDDMGEHTPGPWFVHYCYCAKREAPGQACGITSDPNDNPEAGFRTVDVVSDTCYSECCHMMTEADARLIAAAPDLLAACERALEKMEMIGEYTDGAPPSTYYLEDAIAKAKGK
jgi:hypothetical protein